MYISRMPVKPKKKLEMELGWLTSCFDFAPRERLLLGGILAIAVIGLTTRYLHLRNQRPEPYEPAGLRPAMPGGVYER